MADVITIVVVPAVKKQVKQVCFCVCVSTSIYTPSSPSHVACIMIILSLIDSKTRVEKVAGNQHEA